VYGWRFETIMRICLGVLLLQISIVKREEKRELREPGPASGACIIASSSKAFETGPPVVVRIRDAILVFNVLWPEGHLEPNCHFAFLNVP
jgi:hypothetical protein